MAGLCDVNIPAEKGRRIIAIQPMAEITFQAYLEVGRSCMDFEVGNLNFIETAMDKMECINPEVDSQQDCSQFGHGSALLYSASQRLDPSIGARFLGLVMMHPKLITCDYPG
ncbi:hypothetical protein ANN_18379 [Periplaneta americana]|uniref:Per a allergen n=1 Tax=Periplaneta americana TaxID=6978 RepID=A0ABQ8SNL9_PERAM|nr:hypothetical protein ANN_18379 [Periplaneta americana]